jgi:hypothetical protein
MNETTRDHLRKTRESREKLLEQNIELLDENRVAPERLPSVIASVARDATDIGFLSFLLNDETAGWEWFETAGEYRRREYDATREATGTSSPIVTTLYHGLEATILANGEAEAYFCEHLNETNVADAETDEQFVLTALAYEICALLDQERTAPAPDRPTVEKKLDAGAFVYDDIDKRPLRRAEFACLDALQNEDAAGATDAIETVLDFHREEAVTGDHELATDYYCIPATVLCVLAARVGVPVDIDSRYVPTAVGEGAP